MGSKPGDYKKYHASTKAKKARAARNAARAKAEKAGKVKKGDGKVVHHKVKAKPGGASAAQIKKAKTTVTTKAKNTALSNKQRSKK